MKTADKNSEQSVAETSGLVVPVEKAVAIYDRDVEPVWAVLDAMRATTPARRYVQIAPM